jgi:NADH-quinone oxidoreductase subunit A
MIAAYIALFVGAGAGFLIVNLFLGRLLRPKNPTREKLEIYECGEPTIGSSFVQFDLRFYVVALLFIVFDVEAAFLFPWAVVFGKATHLADPRLSAVVEPAEQKWFIGNRLTDDEQAVLRELGVPEPERQALRPAISDPDPRGDRLAVQTLGRRLAWIALADMGLFFAVLALGFAYVWRLGDLDWVRGAKERRHEPEETSATLDAPEPALSA